MNIDQQEGQSSLNGSNGNDNDDQNTQNNNLPTSHFNEDRCPGKLESTDTVNVKNFQTYTAIVKFKDVPPERIATVLKAYLFECMAKVPDITFYPSDTNILPTPSPISTKKLFPSCNIRFQDFFNVNLSQQEVKVF